MRNAFCLLLAVFFCFSLQAQNDEQLVRNYLKENFPKEPLPQSILFYQCKYKQDKAWQYLVACSSTKNQKQIFTILFATRSHDSLLHIESFAFTSVESFEHLNMDKSKDKVEEFYITTIIDTGNLTDRYSGVYSFKDGKADTLIKFHSFEYKNLKAPWFTFTPGVVVEQEDLCQLADLNADGRTDISNRVHRKIYNKESGTNKDVFSYETDYAEYRFQKGRLIKMKKDAVKEDKEQQQ